MMTRRMPIRWRLTLWSGGLLAVALALLCATLYFSLRHELYRSLDDLLEHQMALTLSSVTISQGVPRLNTSAVHNPSEGEQFLILTDRTGKVSANTGESSTDAPIDRAGLSAALSGQTKLDWINSGDGRIRNLSQPVIAGGQVVGALQLGVYATNVSDTLASLRLIMLIAGPLVLLVTSGGGLWLARQALSPVDRLTRLAAAISEEDLSRRLTEAFPHDEIGRLAGTFNAMLDRLEGAFHRQRQFTADAAHELRTPLALMQSQIEVALAQPRDADEDQAVLESITGDLERVARIAGTLLTLARGDTGKLTVTREDVDLPELLTLVADQYAARSSEDGIILTVKARPARLLGDEDLLIQLFVNLLENAFRYTERGHRITLGSDTMGGITRIWVADEGCGIAPEHLPHLFERFYRADPARGRNQGGAGLGLSICKLIVEAHDGTIEISSKPGTGTVVLVSFPGKP